MSKFYSFLPFLIFYTTFFFGQNSPPTLINDIDTVDFNTTLNVNATAGLLANDFDPDNDTLNITQFIVNGITYAAGQTANLTQGSLTINVDGSYVFIPTTNFSGYVPDIIYTVSDGIHSVSALFQLTVETNQGILKIKRFFSCNQGYTAAGFYKIRYFLYIENTSIARDDHPNSIIQNLQIIDNLESVFGDTCITEIERIGIISLVAEGVSTQIPQAFTGGNYPQDYSSSDWDSTEFSETDPTPGAQGLLNQNSVSNDVLYPRQTLIINFCITIDPNCASSDPIDFDNIINVTSSRGTDSENLLMTDFHTSQTTVAANLYMPNIVNFVSEPPIKPSGIYDYITTVTITNDGNNLANNVNFNMGLGHFLDQSVTFSSIGITQVSGPLMTINSSFDGNVNSKLLTTGNSLNFGETVKLEVRFKTNQIPSSTTRRFFLQLQRSMSQGIADGIDETLPGNLRRFSFVEWSDSSGNHLDRYYLATTNNILPSSNDQCTCTTLGIRFLYSFTLDIEKSITQIDNSSIGILDRKEVTFQLVIKNTSPNIQAHNLQITDDLNTICSGNIVAVNLPTITASTATTNPIINPLFNGISNINIFNGISGVLDPDESVTVEFTVFINEDCLGTNSASFSASDSLANSQTVLDTVAVDISSDIDTDGITNANDIDDDNDTIPDIIENNGLQITLDSDSDGIPDYLDTDAPSFIDADSNGISDLFDFDGDGILNHLDLDSDNDGIFDITEVGNSNLDTNNNGRTNNAVGLNGLDNTVEDVDLFTAIITYTIPNTDAIGYANYQDIDADGDGIVDAVEGQTTVAFTTLNSTFDSNGLDTAFPNGIQPVDKDGDGLPDYIDTNADDDYYTDLIEAWDINNDNVANTVPSNVDFDLDGLDDAFDIDTTQFNPLNGQVPTNFPNLDEPSTAELDWREQLVINVSIANQTVVEGNTMLFDVTTDNPSPTPIVIDLLTVDDTPLSPNFAISPDDFTSASTTITIPQGSLTASTTLTVATIDDIITELAETFTVQGTVTSNNTANTDLSAIGTITDNEPLPTVFVNTVSVDEGEDLVFDITLSNPSSLPITLSFYTQDASALEIIDYISLSSVEVTFPALSTATTITVQSVEDTTYESTENFILAAAITSTNTANVSINSTGTIIDDDDMPTLMLDSPETVEGNLLIFTISLSNLSAFPITFDANSNNISAVSPNDYRALITSETIPPLTALYTVSIITIDDTLNESTETLELNIAVTSSNTANNSVITTGAILDNDLPNLFSPNNDGKSDFFVIDGLQDFPNFSIQIFDRWGNQVYDYTNNGASIPKWWNGTNNGKPVPEGVYYYTIDFNNGRTVPKTSFVELIR